MKTGHHSPVHVNTAKRKRQSARQMQGESNIYLQAKPTKTLSFRWSTGTVPAPEKSPVQYSTDLLPRISAPE